MRQRLEEIDFLKCVFILLMIVFHLVYIGDSYPLAKRFVYTFHIPAFLIISGYLVNVNKAKRDFFKSILWIAVPYAIMETAYLVSSFFLPVRDGISSLVPQEILNRLLTSPIGPYWYLHTIIICEVVYYVFYSCFRNTKGNFFVVVGSCSLLSVLAYWGDLLSVSSVMYFSLGMILGINAVDFRHFFVPSSLSLIPLLLLMLYPDNFERSSVGGILITYLVVSLLLSVYRLLPKKRMSCFLFLGRNTLILLLFSPIFTMAVKPLVGILDFEPTGILFAVVALTISVAGSLMVGKLLDQLKLSRFIFGKHRVLN